MKDATREMSDGEEKKKGAAMDFWTEDALAAQERERRESIEFWTPEPVCKVCKKPMVLSEDDPLLHYEDGGVCMICQMDD